MWWQRKKNTTQKSQEDLNERYQHAINLVKDLDRKEFNRLMDGIKLAWEGYNKIMQIQSIDEKEMAEITEAEKELDFIKEDY